VYVASPYGFSRATKGFYRDEVVKALEVAEFEVLDPWDESAATAQRDAARKEPPGKARRDAYHALNCKLADANVKYIKRAHGILACLDGVDVDSGTAAEIGFAAAAASARRPKPIVGVRFDTRRAGDNEGADVNMQVEHFIRLTGGEVFTTHEGEDERDPLAESVRRLGELIQRNGEPPTPSRPDGSR
jgi:nucleoside 2-deoxyribosyltransferase